MKKLPVFASVREVLSGVSSHYFQLILASWPAILLLLAAFGTMNYLGADFMEASQKNDREATKAALEHLFSGGTGLVLILVLLLFVLTSAIAAVRWHRFVLLGEGADRGYGQIRILRGEDGSYIWTSIKLGLVYLLFAVAVGIFVVLGASIAHAIGGGEEKGSGASMLLFLGITIIYLGVLLVFFRLMIALPDAALGQGGRVMEAFRRTRGNSWRLLGAFLILLVTAAILMVIAGLVLGALSGIGLVGTVIGDILYAGVYLFTLMVQITMLSVAYREIVGMPGEEVSEAAV